MTWQWVTLILGAVTLVGFFAFAIVSTIYRGGK